MKKIDMTLWNALSTSPNNLGEVEKPVEIDNFEYDDLDEAETEINLDNFEYDNFDDDEAEIEVDLDNFEYDDFDDEAEIEFNMDDILGGD